jgi:hypothetical protein
MFFSECRYRPDQNSCTCPTPAAWVAAILNNKDVGSILSDEFFHPFNGRRLGCLSTLPKAPIDEIPRAFKNCEAKPARERVDRQDPSRHAFPNHTEAVSSG